MTVSSQFAVSRCRQRKSPSPAKGKGPEEYRALYSLRTRCIPLFAVLGLMESAAAISRAVVF
jgi:hypothetical protein